MTSTAAASQNSGEAVLSKKEQELFRIVVNCYETKKYKKGMKNADMILKKYPNHGETMAMKGLITNCLGQKVEAYELVKLGVRNGVKSHICWHVFGLLHKSDKNLKEASKCYLNALRIDPGNQNILRDLSALQVQIRDIAGFVQTRRKILDAKPTITSSWVAFAAGNYLGGQYSVAYDVIAKFFEGVTTDKMVKTPEDKHAESELILFQSRCLEKLNKYDAAITHLRNQQHRIVDVLSCRIKIAELLILSSRYAEAVIMWERLLKEQGENYRFHSGFQAAVLKLDTEKASKVFSLKHLDLPSTTLPLSEVEKELLMEAYSRIKFKSRAVSKILLTVATGEQFKILLEAHIRKSLHDEVPALYQDVFALVRDANSVLLRDRIEFRTHPVTQTVIEIVDRFVRNLKASDSFDVVVPKDKDAAKEGSSECSAEDSSRVREAPGALLWSMFLKAHILARCGDVAGALVVVEACLEHTPTALDIHTMKARLQKHSGNLKEAADSMDYCRSLDLQDRYLNNKATKYFLRADRIQEGMETIAMFTKHEGDAEKILFDLQANWYEAELGEAYSRTKQWGLALKKFYAIQKHFQDYIYDMSDFHGFCLRKQTLRSYCDVLLMQDTMYAHPFLQRAARGSIEILLHLIDSPEDIDGLGHLSGPERKKEKAKIKKRKEKDLKVFEEKEKAQAEEAKWNGKENAREEVKDLDPFGEKVLQRNFLVECGVWCSLVAPFRPNNETICGPDTLALVCDVMIRRVKYLPAVRALSTGLSAIPRHPALSLMLVRFALKVGGGGTIGGAAPNEIKTVMQTAVMQEVAALLGGSVLSFVQSYVERVQGGGEGCTLAHRVAAAKMSLIGDKANGKTTAQALLVGEWGSEERQVTVAGLEGVINCLVKELKFDATSPEVLNFKTRAAGYYPLCPTFSTQVQVLESVA